MKAAQWAHSLLLPACLFAAQAIRAQEAAAKAEASSEAATGGSQQQQQTPLQVVQATASRKAAALEMDLQVGAGLWVEESEQQWG